ncbi:MAG: WD40 repeat domain-containing protein [Armatimonadetes bacterium]|nr:WD40 repeat domain-containing protein [Armatimonadota bacterium]
MAHLWDSATGEAIGYPIADGSRITGARFSRDESKILTSNDAGRVAHWSAGGARKADLRFPALTPAVSNDRAARQQYTENLRAALTPDGARLLTFADETHVWDAATGRKIAGPLGHAPTHPFLPGGSRILTWNGQRAHQWLTSTGEPAGSAIDAGSDIRGVAISRDGARILTWSVDRAVCQWNTSTGRASGPTLVHESDVLDASFNANGDRILTRESQRVHLWNASTGKPAMPPFTLGDPIDGAAFSVNDTYIVIHSGTAVRVIDTSSGTQVSRMNHAARINGATPSSRGVRVLTWSDDRRVILWTDIRGSNWAEMRHGSSVQGAVLDPSESTVLSWDHSSVRAWKARTAEMEGPVLHPGAGVRSAQWYPGGTRIVTAGDGGARIWHARTGYHLGDGPIGSGVERGAAVHPAGTHLLTWDHQEARLIHVDADLDFPARHAPLWIQAVTGTRYQPGEQTVYYLTSEEWQRQKSSYERVAEAHARECRYKEANHWLRYRPAKAAQ